MREHGAHPTHPLAESIITELKEPLRKYAEEYARYADAAWVKEYVAKGLVRGYANIES